MKLYRWLNHIKTMCREQLWLRRFLNYPLPIIHVVKIRVRLQKRIHETSQMTTSYQDDVSYHCLSVLAPGGGIRVLWTLLYKPYKRLIWESIYARIYSRTEQFI